MLPCERLGDVSVRAPGAFRRCLGARVSGCRDRFRSLDLAATGSHDVRIAPWSPIESFGGPTFQTQRWCPQGALGTRPLSDDEPDDDPLAWYVA